MSIAIFSSCCWTLHDWNPLIEADSPTDSDPDSEPKLLDAEKHSSSLAKEHPKLDSSRDEEPETEVTPDSDEWNDSESDSEPAWKEPDPDCETKLEAKLRGKLDSKADSKLDSRDSMLLAKEERNDSLSKLSNDAWDSKDASEPVTSCTLSLAACAVNLFNFVGLASLCKFDA